MENINVLFILGDGSLYGNEELKYSLRSLETHAKNIGNVYITGKCPDFIDQSKVIFTPELDIGCPAINHWWKVNQTFEMHPELTGDVFLMYDDIFLAKDVDATKYPYFYRGDLPNYYFGKYQHSLVNAYLFLLDHHKGIRHYGNHCPIIYNRDKFLSLKKYFNELKLSDVGMSVRAVYGNMFEVGGTEQEDLKIRAEVYNLDELLAGRDCFSTADEVFHGNVEKWLVQHFPNKSRWEK